MYTNVIFTECQQNISKYLEVGHMDYPSIIKLIITNKSLRQIHNFSLINV